MIVRSRSVATKNLQILVPTTFRDSTRPYVNFHTFQKTRDIAIDNLGDKSRCRDEQAQTSSGYVYMYMAVRMTARHTGLKVDTAYTGHSKYVCVQPTIEFGMAV